MDWTAPVGTALGGLIGVVSTLVAHRAQWRKEARKQEREELRTACVQFLSAVTQAREQIFRASRESRAEERAGRAQDALAEHEVFPARIQLHLAAPPELADLSRESVHLLIAYRDAVVNGEPHQEAEAEFTRHRAGLTRAMQEALSYSR
ncbi:hypothetical protein M1P56_14950 [Streptomyces sp. HU2014]|uniref:Reelin domain-containing protein n=1 Tax=Streptomyces albireticuli TaxID=1940 RepID=A0A1Z2LD92_9ACTN|nr:MULTISPECIES: hypothetical protein [Streptomyces]ARZ72181.1 hypothetical protein SMD11_6605 [Streptomyces albireticuli]UQI45555.1 hypothetical protein M1P56_14950 [Streptomyces sp. HU2014]